MVTDQGLRQALAENPARHAGPSHTRRMELCRDAVLAGNGLHYVAHYTDGVCDFSTDVLAHPAFSPAPDEEMLRLRRDEYWRVGAQLTYRMNLVDERLDELRSGALIRVVVQTDRGTAFCNSVIPGEHLVAFAFAPGQSSGAWLNSSLPELPYVRNADRASAALATRLRALVSQVGQNPGGWLTMPDDAEAPSRAAPTEASTTQFIPYLQGARHRQAELLQRAVDSRTLHYAAYHRDNDLSSVDVLEHPDLSVFFGQISPAARRTIYGQLSEELALFLATQFGRDIYPAIGGPVARLVLDIEQGAIFYYRLEVDDHVLGATVDQSRVSQADDAMGHLVLACRDLHPDRSVVGNVSRAGD